MRRIENLIDEYGDSIYSFCMKLTNNKDHAEDLYQQTFLKIIEIREKIDYNMNPKNLIIAVAIGLWKNSIRKKARHNRILPSLDYLDIYEERIGDDKINLELHVINNETIGEVREAIFTLKDKYKIPIILHYNMEMSICEIAKLLKIPNGTVKSRLYKARELIKKRLEVCNYEWTESGKYGGFA